MELKMCLSSNASNSGQKNWWQLLDHPHLDGLAGCTAVSQSIAHDQCQKISEMELLPEEVRNIHLRTIPPCLRDKFAPGPP